MSEGQVDNGDGEAVERRNGPLGMLPVALVLLVGLVTLVSSATASDVPSGETQAPGDPVQLTDPKVADELPHTGLDRSEVIELVAGVFEVQLQSPAGPFDNLEVDHFISDSAAVIAADQRPDPSGLIVGGTVDRSQEDTRLLESTFPLKKDGEALDLGLEQSGEVLEPVNPLVEVKLPSELGRPIELPEIGVKITLDEASPDRAPSVVENTAVYPNVAADTDFIAAPTPTGLETMTMLRSSEAPESQFYKLDIPADATLGEEAGAAVVQIDGRTILRVSAPHAIDANGNAVPTSLTVRGEGLQVDTTTDQTTAFPVLVDPVFEWYAWYGGSNQANWSEWKTESSNTPGLTADFRYYPGTVLNGFSAIANQGFYGAGSFAKVTHPVPRLQQEEAYGREPTSYITAMTLSNVSYWIYNGPADPFANVGIWNTATKNWAEQGTAEWHNSGSTALTGGTISITAGKDQMAHRAVIVGLKATVAATVPDPGRELYVGGATFEVTDGDNPTVTKGSYSASWADQVATSAISATLSDQGLGAKRMKFDLPGQAPVAINNSCAGNVSEPCPLEWRPSVKASEYKTGPMPQGWLSIPITGEDVIGHKSVAGTAEIGIDHTAPSLSSLSGTLTQQGALGTHKLQYGLTFSATDGFEAPAVVQKSFGTSGTGNSQFNNPMGAAVDGNGNVLVVDRNNNRVEKFDQNGNYLGQFGNAGTETQKLLEPRMIAVMPSGKIWVSDTGHQRLAQYSSAGVYLREFKDATLTTPYGVTVAPGGYVWFTNHSTGEVVKALEASDGTLSIVKKVKGTSDYGSDTTFSTPGGLAADSQGNVWVTDIGHHRLQKISAGGEIVAQIGSSGTGIAQFNHPYGVAVTSLGHLLVADADNNRIQLLDTQGDMLRILGAGTFNSPKAVAVGPGNTAFVTDWGNHRVQKWSNVDLDSQSGIVQSEVLVDGQPRDVFKPTCSGQAVCSIPSRSWTLNAREYTEGTHSVQVAAIDAVGLRSVSAPLDIELHPDRTAPVLTLGGTMTEQASLGATRPTYKLKLTASDPEPKEGSFVLDGAFGGAGGPTAEGKFFQPADAAVDSSGSVWVADTGNDRFEKFGPLGEFLKKAGSSGSAAGQLKAPGGVAVDVAKNIWVADTGNNRVVEFKENGEFLRTFGTNVNKTKVEAGGTQAEKNLCTAASGNVCQAATAGSAAGQLKSPQGIVVTPTSTIWVADTGNGRLQKFDMSGGYISSLSSEGTAPGQLKEPMGVTIAADGSLWVADYGNKRIQQWSNASFVRAVGKEGIGAGEFKGPTGVEADPKGNIWVSDVSSRRVQQFDSTGHYMMGYGSGQPAEDTLGPWMPRGLAYGSQNYLYVVDSMNHRVQRWTPSALSQSGVVSSSIKVDGKVVDSYNPGCPAEHCSLSREWSMTSSSFAAGAHTVDAMVTDGSGLTTTKTLTINIQRDTVSPELSLSGALAEAPEGWVQEGTRSLTADAADPNGYGVKQIRFQIDGSVVGESLIQTCEQGGCPKSKTVWIDMTQYGGGAHQGVVIAEDLAGNVRKRTWTINIDPLGQISASEATDTLEAVENTVGANQSFEPVASTEEFLEPEVIQAGDNPGMTIQTGNIVSNGVTVDTEFDPNTEVFTIEGTEGSIELKPAITTSQPEVSEEVAGVIPGTFVPVDLVVRPEYNGAFMFTMIRDVNAPEQYVWHVGLNPGQSLVQADKSHIQVMSKTGAEAWLITATSARDATGDAVPTTVAVQGTDEIVFSIPHKASNFVYPISAGQSYETGYALVTSVFESESEGGEHIEVEVEDDEIPPEPDGFEPAPDHEWTEAELAAYVKGSHYAHPTVVPAPRPVGPDEIYQQVYRSQCGPTCGKWNAKVYNATYFTHFADDSDKEPLMTTWWEGGSEVHATVTQERKYVLWFNTTIHNCGAVGPKKVTWGSHEQLRAYGHFTVESLISKNGFKPEDNFTLTAWVYPNGFQQKHVNWEWGGQPSDHVCPRVAVEW